MSEFNANQLNPDNINGGKKFNKGDGFSANDLNSVVEGILYSETQGGTVDLTEYQKKTDNGLLTTDKTIVGAINEVNEKVGQGGSSIEVDAELSSTSENPVQNKVINEALLKNLLNVTIIDQDLSKADFVPTPNTYYRHTNKYNNLYNYGTILFYNGTDYEIVEVLNGFVSKWESIVGGYGTLLMRGTSGKYSSVGIGTVGVTNVGFVPTYVQRTATDGTKSTVLVTGNPVNDVDATPKKYVDDLVASVKWYKHTFSLRIYDDTSLSVGYVDNEVIGYAPYPTQATTIDEVFSAIIPLKNLLVNFKYYDNSLNDYRTATGFIDIYGNTNGNDAVTMKSFDFSSTGIHYIQLITDTVEEV